MNTQLLWITKYMWMNTKLLYNNQVYVGEYEMII